MLMFGSMLVCLTNSCSKKKNGILGFGLEF